MLKRLGFAALLLLAGCVIGDGGSRADESRCMSVKPICPPGKHPMCICESDYSYKCMWICAG
jgi:hypothetical protein